ncbi:MAG TPA: DUF389 domain-containing protein [Candidatus Sulfomarinibacteraceae bacterium]|nr:DUF389 domain-containing protein [Candidatus Sulfomarinibacteraceae bacterium]
MEIIDGKIPEGKKWRVLTLLNPQQDPGLAWRFALQLAEASGGEAVALIIVPDSETEQVVSEARQVIAQAGKDISEDHVYHHLLIAAADFHKALTSMIERADIDLLLADGDSPQWRRLDRLPCPAAVIRGSAYQTYRQTSAESQAQATEKEPDKSAEELYGQPIRRILVPTAGGPNSASALSFLLPLAPEVEITALYVAPSYLGPNEEAHGRARLRQLTKFTDANERIEARVVQANSATAGIVEEASGAYDLVIIGASRESTIDRALFGDVVSAVVRESRTPVAVVWEPSSPVGDLARTLAWRLQRVIPRLDLGERTDVYVRIRRSARPDIDFFVLMGLSALIAALGMLLESPAVVIGAMLVAPLMSPMIGAGLAIVLGNPRFLRLSVAAVLKGALLSIVLGVATGFLQVDQPLTTEIVSRTQPTLLDLGVALFAGLAGAYALAHSTAAAALPGVAISAALVPPLAAIGITLATGHFRQSLGAVLLFSTNLTAIVAAAVLVFLMLGFRPTREQKTQRLVQQRSVRVAMLLLGAITLVLGITTYELAGEAALETRIREVVDAHVSELEGTELAEPVIIENLTERREPLTLHLTLRSTGPILHQQAESLRRAIGSDLSPHVDGDREIAMTVTVIRVTFLDPEVPPTPLPTPENNLSSP